ncbi:MAG TPA: hypothetical protein VE010_14990 [Thermoanaerobaculia bacterium]|nr:hypothetical protein [Thermoanaerobaculia bacterium]
MNRPLVVLVLATLCCVAVTGLLIVFAAERAYTNAGAAQWPGGLGALTAAPERFPAVATNAAAARFTTLAARLDPPAEVSAYLKSEVERADTEIASPSASVLAYITQQAATIDLIRDHLLTAGEMVWEHDPAKGFESKPPNLLVPLRAARLLMIRALTAEDGEALRAASRLAEPLLARPETISNTIGIAILRDVTAVAAKLPIEVRPWIADLLRADPERALARSMQYDTWLLWAHGSGEAERIATAAAGPFFHISLANYVRHQRETLAPLLHVVNCGGDVDSYFADRLENIPRWNVLARIAIPAIGSTWARAFRYRAEREATLNAIRAASGEPIVSTSKCHGTWSSEVLSAGRQRVWYSRAIPKSGERDTEIPLERTTRARTTRQST